MDAYTITGIIAGAEAVDAKRRSDAYRTGHS